LREQDEAGEFSYPQSGCSDADAAHATVPLQVVVIVGQMAAGISLHFPLRRTKCRR
jgi:hypothetical protein